MSNSLAKKFNFISLIKFTLPNIIMMMFLSLYTIIDGIFISRYAGPVDLSALNMSFPIICIEMAIGVMFSTGGSAIIAKKMGEGKDKEAKENFTFILLVLFIIGIILSIIFLTNMHPILNALGVTKIQYKPCSLYTKIIVLFAPIYFMQSAFQVFFATAGKPHIGLISTILGGLTNMIFDYIFIALLGFGVKGAAMATVMGYCVPASIGLTYFTFNRKGTLYFKKFKPDFKMLLKACSNGSSEMVTNIATGVTTFLFNILFMKYYKEDGVAAISIILYFQFVFMAVYLGFSMGVAPIISFKYGMKDNVQLKKIFKNSMIFIFTCSIITYALSMIVMEPAVAIFAKRGTNVFHITISGYPLFAISFLLMGINIFASSLFTALSNGKVSAIISFSRTFLFLVGSLLILPKFLGETGVWIAVSVAEGLGIIISLFFIVTRRKIYNYI